MPRFNIINYDNIFEFHQKYIDQYINLLSQLTSCPKETSDNIEFQKHLDYIKYNPYYRLYFVHDNENDDLVGCGTLLIEHKVIHNMGIVGHIEDIVINSNYRKYSLGKMLIDHIKNECKELNCYKIILDCSDNVIGFYEKCGFTKKGNQMALYY